MYIYVFRYNNICKIGVTSDPKMRIKSFPFMSIEWSIKTKKARSVESGLHNYFSKNNIGGEFFKDIKTDNFDTLVKSLEIGSLQDKDPDSYIELDSIGENIPIYNDFVNFTFFRNALKNSEKHYLYNDAGNFNKKKNNIKFIEQFEYDMCFSPIKTDLDKYKSTYVHVFLFVEIIRSLNDPQLEIDCYEYLYPIKKR